MSRIPFDTVELRNIAGLDDMVLLADTELLKRDIEAVNENLKEQFFEKYKESLTENCYYEKYSFDLRNLPHPNEVAAVVEGLKRAERMRCTDEDELSPRQLMRDAMEQVMEENRWYTEPESCLFNQLGGEFTRTLRCEMLDALEDANIPVVNSVWGADFERELILRGAEAVAEADKSDVLEIMDHVRTVRIAYNPFFSHQHRTGGLEFDRSEINKSTVVPDENFAQLLLMAGVHPADYRDHLRAVNDFDQDSAPEWDAFIDAWEAPRETGFAPAIGMEDLDTILDNLYAGGVPVIVADISVKEMLDGMNSDRMVIKGGQIGVHDFWGGSGHLVDIKGSAVASPSMARWEFVGEGSEFGCCPLNEVYNMTNQAFECEIVNESVDTVQEDRSELGM